MDNPSLPSSHAYRFNETAYEVEWNGITVTRTPSPPVTSKTNANYINPT